MAAAGFIVALAAVLSSRMFGSGRLSEAGNFGQKVDSNVVLPTRFYFQSQFTTALADAKRLQTDWPESRVIGGIIPHDIQRGMYIADFFQNLSKQSPKQLIIIGPNHFEQGSYPVLTSTAGWQTEFSVVRADVPAVNQLLNSGMAGQDDQVLVSDHSLAGIIPYLAYYLPEAKVVPLLLKSEIRLQEINDLLKIINKIKTADTVVVAAVDFSHYLTKQTAYINDQITQKAMERFDYQTILSFGMRFNDYLDSPPSIAVLLKYLSDAGIKHSQVLHHLNSGDRSGDPQVSTTSYFEMIYF